MTNNDNQDTLKFTLNLPDLISIDILAVYATSADCPNNFWNNVHDISTTGDSPHRIILGDFNCTLNHSVDSRGYKTDPHPKSRKVINGIIDNEEFIDSFRHFHPDTKAYTFRNKENSLWGRLDYGLISPSLIPFVKNVEHTAHNYEFSDHASFSITLDITESAQGKGIFRCNPRLPNANKEHHKENHTRLP